MRQRIKEAWEGLTQQRFVRENRRHLRQDGPRTQITTQGDHD